MTFTGNKFPGLLLLEVISKENGKTIYESIQKRKFLIFIIIMPLYSVLENKGIRVHNVKEAMDII